MSKADPSAPRSRHSKTNRADPRDGRYGPKTGELLSTRLSERDGVTLREEVRDYGALGGVRPMTVRESVEAFRAYILGKREDGTPIFENPVGERVEGSSRPHRFHPDVGDRQYAKLSDLEATVRERWGRLAHSALLSLTCRSTDENGEPIPPVDHLDELLSSWKAVKKALNRVLDDREAYRVRILDVHESGYLHVHVGVFVKGSIDAEAFQPVIDAHLRNCDLAGEDAHEIVPHRPDESSVSVHRIGTDRNDGEIENLSAYLAEYLGTYSGDPLDQPEHVQIANTVLWATGRRRFQPGGDAQDVMKYEPETEDDGEEWNLVAFKDEDGEEYEIVGERSGGVDYFTTGSKPPPTD